MKKNTFTPIDYCYENDLWNPVPNVQDEDYEIVDSGKTLSVVEKTYILSYKKIWDRLSKY